MGEMAEMMLDGTMCAGCGCFLDGEADGVPRYCSDECDPHFEESPLPPRHEKPFFVVKHKGSIRALPRFLAGIVFDYFNDSDCDKRGKPLIRLHYDKYPEKDHAWGVETRGIICVVAPHMKDQAVEIVKKHLEERAKTQPSDFEQKTVPFQPENTDANS